MHPFLPLHESETNLDRLHHAKEPTRAEKPIHAKKPTHIKKGIDASETNLDRLCQLRASDGVEHNIGTYAESVGNVG
eukprot:359397-Chlamydomonas_euryale.AAC.2